MNLSPHFALDEFVVSETAARHGLDNSPNAEQLENLRLLARMLESVRVVLNEKPIIVTSGYRSPAVNALVKGSANSAHMSGLAADFISPGFGDPLAVCRAIEGSNVSFDQLILEFFTGPGRGWTHFGVGGQWRRQVWTINSQGVRAGIWAPG